LSNINNTERKATAATASSTSRITTTTYDIHTHLENT
jgi:hypothetical protein